MAFPQTHLRSISLPSRLDQTHPKNLELELEKLKSSCSATSETIQSGLLGLAELYNSVEEFTQKSSHIQDGKSMEESLSHSVDVLDACTAVRELLQMIRENVHVLQSALRRKGMDSGVQNDVAAYFCFRKRMHKTVAKTLKNLKKSESAIIKNGSNHSVHADSEFSIVFRQLTATTISVLKSVLVFLSSSMAAARPGGWSLVSKLMTAKSGKESEVANEIGNMDLALSCLNQGKMTSDGARVGDVQKTLQIVDVVIEGFEGGLERLFRQLIQTRVSLLNILTDH